MTKESNNSSRRRIAIVGGGVSGLSAAYFLEDASDFEVTLYERLNRLGGNALTLDAKTPDGKPYSVDPVAYIFVKHRYPYFTAWLRHLDIKTLPIDFGNYLWDGHRGRGMLITSNLKKTLFNPGRSLRNFRNLYLFKQVIKTINKFEKQGKLHDRLLMKEFMEHVPAIDSTFLNEVFYPLMSFAFHISHVSIADMPCGTMLRTYANVARDPKATYCVDGGVKKYVEAVHKSLKRTKVLMNSNVKAVYKVGQEKPVWKVTTEDGTTHEYDQVLLALWPNQAAEVLRNGFEQEAAVPEIQKTVNVLSKVEHVHCRSTIHNDVSVMPLDKSNWTSYSYKYIPYIKTVVATIWSGQAHKAEVFTSYDWSLQKEGVSDEFVLTKPQEPIHGSNVHIRTLPRIPLYDAQDHINANQGRHGLWFTGCYMRETGFHEDGLSTTVDVLKKLVPDYSKLTRLQRLLNEVKTSWK